MRASVRAIFTVLLLTTAILLTGCGHKHEEGDGHNHGKGDGHSHGEETASGAEFKAGKGIILAVETRQNLGVTIADVSERLVPNQIRFTVHLFGEKHNHPIQNADHTGCDVHGSAFLPTATATLIRTGQAVQVLKKPDQQLDGVVLAIEKSLALGESEIVVGISNAATILKPGEFAPARIQLPRDEMVTAIPQSALLRSAEGTFVYVVNGDAYLRTPVKIGAEADGWIEITDGISPGVQVITHPVQTLWLIELRATKGGGHSH